MNKGDVDIDFFNRDDLLSKIKHVVASRLEKGEFRKHNSGVYLQNIPFNPLTGLSAIEYETAEQRGYFKLDLLNVSAYKDVSSEAHLIRLLEAEPMWELLHEKEICDQLVHVNGYDQLLSKVNPRSVIELAMTLAMIRPGKKHLITRCVDKGFASIENMIWEKTDDGFSFKKSHSVAYALLVVMQLNKLCESLLSAPF